MELSEENIEALLSEGRAALDQLKALGEAEVPHNLAEAVKKGVEVTILIGQAAVLVHYPAEERHADRKRVIRLDDALRIMQEMEDEYLKMTVEGTLRVLWGFFTFVPGVIVSLVTGLWKALRELDYDLAKQAFLRLWREVLRNLLSAVAATEIVGPLQDALKLRKRVDVRMRAKALKQRTNAKRVWRRKRTRG